MAKTVVLVGHCGPDSGYLKIIVKKAVGDVKIVSADDARQFSAVLETGGQTGGETSRAADVPDLILFNRELGYGFDPSTGVEMIALLHRSYPNLKMMLVSNYADAQAAAEAAGALGGFGKRELGTPRVVQVLREALGLGVDAIN